MHASRLSQDCCCAIRRFFRFFFRGRNDTKAPLFFDESMRRVFATWKDSGLECARDAHFEGVIFKSFYGGLDRGQYFVWI